MQFGRSSEKLNAEIAQLELSLDEIYEEEGVQDAAQSPAVEKLTKKRQRRTSFGHLPFEEIRKDLPSRNCPCCGGELHQVGESVSEMLDFVPAQLRVLRIRRPNMAVVPAGRSIRSQPRSGRSPKGWRRRDYWRTSSSASIAITPHCTVNRRSSPGMGSRSIARRWRTGWVSLLVAQTIARAACRSCLLVCQAFCRRHDDAGARSWPGSHQNWEALGLCPR